MDPEISVKRLTRFTDKGTLKAFVDITIGEHFLVKGLRVVDGRKGLFVSMPRQKTKDETWIDSVEALSKSAKAVVDRVVLEAYHQETEMVVVS